MKNFEIDHGMLQLIAQNPSAFMKAVFLDSVRIEAMLKCSEEMPEDKLLEMARRIKPLVRMVDGRKLHVGEKISNSYLVYTQPFDVRDSYYYNFQPKHAVCGKDGKPMKVEGLKEVGRFICYHRYGGYWLFVRPGVDEVLQQLPVEFADRQIDAFEIEFSSDACHDIWNAKIDRHISTVILYALENGLPEEVKNQSVIINEKSY